MPTKWDWDDRRRAKKMSKNGADIDQVAEVMGCSVSQAYNLVFDKLPPVNPSPLIRLLSTLGEGTVIPPVYAIDEALARAAYPRTLTMRICGDPVLNQQAAYLTEKGRQRI